MNPKRRQRLALVLFIVAGVSVAVGLALRALNENINLFYTPSQILAGEAPVGVRIRGGGLVVPGSIRRDDQSLRVEFSVTDTDAEIRVAYTGILPDLFREGQGIIAQGVVDESGVLQASEVLAKHDENYMPPEVQEAIEAAGHPGAAKGVTDGT